MEWADLERAADRFWTKVERGEPDACWPWTAGRFYQGYGAFHVRRNPRPASRVALALHLGRPIATGLQVLHACDTPSCCNPAHLREGTARRGEANPHAKLTDAQVAEIRARAGSHKAIAREFGVNAAIIDRIFLGRR